MAGSSGSSGMDMSGSGVNVPPGLFPGHQTDQSLSQAALIDMIKAEFDQNRTTMTGQLDRIQGNLIEAQKEYRQDGADLKKEIATMQKVIEDKFDEAKVQEHQEREAMKEGILTSVRNELTNADAAYRTAEQDRQAVFGELSKGVKETQNSFQETQTKVNEMSTTMNLVVTQTQEKVKSIENTLRTADTFVQSRIIQDILGPQQIEIQTLRNEIITRTKESSRQRWTS